MIFLVLLTCAVQHGVAHINRQRDLQRISRLSKQAKSIAYGPKGVPFEKGVKRKVRVPLSVPDTSSEDMDNNRSSTGRMIDLMVDGTDVYVVSLPGSSSSRRYSSHIALRLLTTHPPKKQVSSHGQALLDESMAPAPRLIDTWAIYLIRSLYSKVPFVKQKAVVRTVQDGHTDVPEEDLTDGFFSEGNLDSSDTGKVGKSTTRRRKPTGGKRK